MKYLMILVLALGVSGCLAELGVKLGVEIALQIPSQIVTEIAGSGLASALGKEGRKKNYRKNYVNEALQFTDEVICGGVYEAREHLIKEAKRRGLTCPEW